MSLLLKKDDLQTLWIHGCFVAPSLPFSTSVVAFVHPLGGMQAFLDRFWSARGLRHAALVDSDCRSVAVSIESSWLSFTPHRAFLFTFSIAKNIASAARCRKYITVRWKAGWNKSRHVCSGGMWAEAEALGVCVCMFAFVSVRSKGQQRS